MASSEKEKMLAGEVYWADDPALVADRRGCRALLRRLNAEIDDDARSALLRDLLGGVGDGTVIESPFLCDYGYNITVGTKVFVNYNAIVLDVAPVVIGDHVQIATAVQILTADHPREPERRRREEECGAAITIEDNVWIGGGAILCPGVTVGADTVIGAGSVVTKDLRPGVVAAGNPCRVIREQQ